MAQLVGIAFFTHEGGGWSETYPMITEDYVEAGTNLEELMTARLQFMQASVENVGGRVSDITVTGDSLVVESQGVGLYVPAPGTDVEVNNVALKLLSLSGFTARGTRYLHGINESDHNGEIWAPPAIVDGFLDDYMALLSVKCGILHRVTPPPGATYSILPINSVIKKGVWTRNTGRGFFRHRGRRRAA